MVIAIDGPAGSGKSTTAKLLASKLGYIYINTGYMYRAITLKFINNNIDIGDINSVEEVLSRTEFDFIEDGTSELIMDGEDVSEKLNSKDIIEKVSIVSANPIIRKKLVEYQRKMSIGKDVVLEGRDIGTVVFPNANLKFYLIADIKERAMRRQLQLKENGYHVSLSELIDALNKRDLNDINREISPLIKANDAIEIDTTNLNIDDQVSQMLDIVMTTIKKEQDSK